MSGGEDRYVSRWLQNRDRYHHAGVLARFEHREGGDDTCQESVVRVVIMIVYR